MKKRKKRADVAILDQNDGVIQRILAKALDKNSVSFEDEFHVLLKNKGHINPESDKNSITGHNYF